MPLANVNAPIGFRTALQGGKRLPRRVERPVASGRASNLMVGDSYSLDASGNAYRALGSESDAATAVAGVVEGFRLQANPAIPEGSASQDYIPDSQAGAVIGIEDPDCEFEVMASTFAMTDIGKDVNLTNIAGDSVPLRQSRQYIDMATAGTGGTGQFKIIDIDQSPADNAVGAFARIVVRILNLVL